MKNMRRAWMSLLFAIVITLLWLAGCGGSGEQPQEGKPPRSDPTVKPETATHESVGHSHNAPHGGMISSVGNYHLEMTLDAKNKSFVLYVLGEDALKAYAIEAKPITAQVKVGSGDYTALELTPIPLADESKGTSSRFTGAGGTEMYTKGAVEVVLRLNLDGKNCRAIFQFTEDQTTKVYICPMGCEKDKVYPAPGKCPVCQMDLVEPTAAHADHNPKHGGDFFMAPDKWHHLEGVLASPTEFHLYFYNNFTKPIAAEPFLKSAGAEVMTVSDKGKEQTQPLQLKSSKDGDFLSADLPNGLGYPLYVTVRIKFFDTQEKPDPFSFSFHELSVFKE